MWRIVRRQLLTGQSVIADRPLMYPESYETAYHLAQQMNAQLCLIECSCPDEDEWQRRIEQRKALALPPHHQTDWKLFQSVRTSSPLPYPITSPMLSLNTNQPLSILLETCKAWLSSQKAIPE
jgi:hypothetical protein